MHAFFGRAVNLYLTLLVENNSHVFYVGSSGQKVSIVMVPSFANSGCCVLLNLRTLLCQTVEFSSGLKHGNNVEDMET